MKGEKCMWVVTWHGGIEIYWIAEDARFAYWILRINGYEPGITYWRTYPGTVYERRDHSYLDLRIEA
jgi:hypothetical protein